jgi:uncharacterized membrane protein required for colicin V production
VTWFDLGALAIIALAIVDGARSGLAWSVAELLLVLGTATLTALLRPLVEPYVGKVFEIAQTDLPWATHAIVFVTLALGSAGIAYLIHPLVRRWRFDHDPWPGGVVGAVSGCTLALVLFAMAAWSGPRAYEEQLKTSRTTWLLIETWETGATLLFPEPLGHRLEDLRTP